MTPYDSERHPCVAGYLTAPPDAEQIRRVEDVLKANFSAARVGADANATETNPEPRNCPARQPGRLRTAAHLIAALPQAHDVIVFSTRLGEGIWARSLRPRAAFTLYLCYLMLGDDESSEERAAELYRASRGRARLRPYILAQQIPCLVPLPAACRGR